MKTILYNKYTGDKMNEKQDYSVFMVYKGRKVIYDKQHKETINHFKISKDILETIFKRAIDKIFLDESCCDDSEACLIYSKEFDQGILVKFTSESDKYLLVKLILPPGRYLNSKIKTDCLYEEDFVFGSESVKNYLANLFFGDDIAEIYPKTEKYKPKTVVVDGDLDDIDDEDPYFDIEIVKKYAMEFIIMGGKIYDVVDIGILEVK